MSGTNHRITELERKVVKLEHLVNTPRQDDPHSVAGENQTQQKDKSASFSVVHAPKDPEDPHHNGDATPPWRKIARNKLRVSWRKILSTVGILAGIGYALVTYLQWRDLKHNFMVEQRAWMRLEATVSSSFPIENMFSQIEFTNVGKSPALGVEIDAMLMIVDSAKAPSLAMKEGASTNVHGISFPMDKGVFGVGAFPNNQYGSIRKFTSPEIKSLIAGDSYIVIVAIARYHDQFGPHWTRFCTWNGYGTGYHHYNAITCPNYNAVGDGAISKDGTKPE